MDWAQGNWEIFSNFNCDLESQLGFLAEEGKINLAFLLEKKILFFGVEGSYLNNLAFLLEKERLFLVWKEVTRICLILPKVSLL